MLRIKGRPERSQRRAHGRRTAHPHRRQEAGEGKGANSAQRRHLYQMANRLPVSNQRLPEIQDGRHLPGGSRLEISSPEQTQGAPHQCGWKLRLGPRRGEGAPHPGECARQAPGCLSRSGWGRHKTQAQPNPRFCGVPKNWNRMQRRAHSL